MPSWFWSSRPDLHVTRVRLRALSLALRVITVLPLGACSPPASPHPSVAAVTVPTGAWQRDWIRRHGGAPDARVTVRYVQTPSVFGDLRIPGDRPDVALAASLTELTDDQLAALARQNGFAGFTTVDGANATWHHEIDFQPAGDADIGRIEPAGDGRMFEHALDDSYVESWSGSGTCGKTVTEAPARESRRTIERLAP